MSSNISKATATNYKARASLKVGESIKGRAVLVVSSGVFEYVRLRLFLKSDQETRGRKSRGGT